MNTVVTSGEKSTKLSRALLERIARETWDEARDKRNDEINKSLAHFKVSRATVLAVNLALARYCSFEHADCYPTVETLAAKVERSTKSVQRALRASERIGLIETRVGDDAWAVYGRDPRAQDKRRRAYLHVGVQRALNLPDRAPLKDTRTSWKQHCSRVAQRAQARRCKREQERLLGERGVMLLRPRTSVADAAVEMPRKTGPRWGGLAAAGAVVQRPTTSVQRKVDTGTDQPLSQGGVQSNRVPLTLAITFTRAQQAFESLQKKRNGGAIPPE